MCNLSVNYADVPGERIIPFKIELDLAASNLNPAPGENQRFCYNIKGVGKDEPIFADLSHLLFGICDTLTIDQITNISVNRDGIAETIIIGNNVELKTDENPDNPTGCAGLKFNFGFNKVTGVMKICYELKVPHPIGANSVCLFGGGVAAIGLSVCGPVCSNVGTCSAVGYQPVSVCVPVTVTPFAHRGVPTTYCCGEPTIIPGEELCPGVVNGSCKFTMSQEICVAVPVEFGAFTKVGDTSVLCGDATNKDVCTNCNEDTTQG